MDHPETCNVVESETVDTGVNATSGKWETSRCNGCGVVTIEEWMD